MKVRLSSNLKHDGKRFAVGEIVDLKDDVAKRLIAVGAAEAAAPKESRAEREAREKAEAEAREKADREAREKAEAEARARGGAGGAGV